MAYTAHDVRHRVQLLYCRLHIAMSCTVRHLRWHGMHSTNKHCCVQVQYGRVSGDLGRTATGSSACYTQTYSNASYTSAFSHHVKLPHLLPNTTYWYRCASSQATSTQRHTCVHISGKTSNAFCTSAFSRHVKLPHLLPNTTYWSSCGPAHVCFMYNLMLVSVI